MAQQHRQTDAEAWVERLTGVDIAGAGSTIGADEMTTGAASMKKALVGGFGTDEQSPAGRSLLAAYTAWRARQGSVPEVVLKQLSVSRDEVDSSREKAAKKAAKKLRRARSAIAVAGPAAVERRAVEKGSKRMRLHLAEGADRDTALDRGFAHYRKHGGTATRATFARKVGP